MKTKAILTFDLEFWHNDLLLEKYLPEDKNSLADRTEDYVGPILDWLKEQGTKATFFVLGKLAEKHPVLIKRISEEGHEIASHGYSHSCLWDLDKESFGKEIRLTNQIIESILGKKAVGFRAPNFSWQRKNDWAFPVLEQNNFLYDSSIFPLKTPLYGVADAPLSIHRVDSLTEFPVSVFRTGPIGFPVGGGFYFRAIPFSLYLFLLKRVARQRIPVLYFHPHELSDSIPPLPDIPWRLKKLKFYGVKHSFKKFKLLFDHFDFISVQEYLNSSLRFAKLDI